MLLSIRTWSLQFLVMNVFDVWDKTSGCPKREIWSPKRKNLFVFLSISTTFYVWKYQKEKFGDKIPHFWFFSPRWMLRMRIVYCWSKQLLLSAGNNYHARLATLSVSVFRVRMSLKFCKNPNRRKWLFVFPVSTNCQFGVLTSVRLTTDWPFTS